MPVYLPLWDFDKGIALSEEYTRRLFEDARV